MKKIFKITVLACLFSILFVNEGISQVLDGIYAKEHVPSRKAIPYKYLREADVMYSKKITRIVDLREKLNHPLYFPTTQIGDRRSLIDLLLWGISTDGLTAYGIDDDRFTQPISRSQIESNFGAGEQTITYLDENGNEQSKVIKNEVISSEVKQLMIKEEWFFDKQHSMMDVRIIGVCPIRFFTKDLGEAGGDEGTISKSLVFWVYFPEARRVLANHEVFNEFNDAERRTYDDIFFKRKFSSYVSRESNVYDDRRVNEYTQGLQSLLESDEIKEKLANYEHDLWEF